MVTNQKIAAFNSSIHSRDLFDCGVPELNQYLKERAGQEQYKNISAVYVATGKKNERVLGFYTLSSYAIQFHDLPVELIKKLPRYPYMPVTLLGRLAVDLAHKGQGLGKYLVIDAFARVLQWSKEIATLGVMVDVKSDEVKNFYIKFGFIELPKEKRKMFIPLAQIKKLIDG